MAVRKTESTFVTIRPFTCDSDDTFFHSHRDATLNVRWVYVHMIEEYARHNGHADLLREAIDGETGE